MKFKKHIIVYGFPDALKDDIVISKPVHLTIDGVGKINALSHMRIDLLVELLDKHKITYTLPPHERKVKIKTLLRGNKRPYVKGRLRNKDIIYTVNANTETELKNKTNATLKELSDLNVGHSEVCTWFCNTDTVESTKKTRKKKQIPTDSGTSKELKRLATIIEDQQQDICDLKGKTLEKAKCEDRAVMAEVLS